MSLISVGVLLFSAFLHAIWNGLLRQAGDKYLAMWWATVVGAIVSLPLIWLGPPMPLYGWGYVLASAIFEALYFLLLVTAYRYGDFSVVYPIARGSAPGLLAIWAFLFLGERPTPLAGIGIAVLVVGLIIVGVQRQPNAATPRPSYHSILLAIGVAITISLYSVIDGAAVQRLNLWSYSGWVPLFIVLFLTPIIVSRFGTTALIGEWRSSAPRLIATGVLMTFVYLLVLGVYQIAPVSYAGAIREVSVVFAALLGKIWFHETVGVRRAVGVIVIFCGAMLITIG